MIAFHRSFHNDSGSFGWTLAWQWTGVIAGDETNLRSKVRLDCGGSRGVECCDLLIVRRALAARGATQSSAAPWSAAVGQAETQPPGSSLLLPVLLGRV